MIIEGSRDHGINPRIRGNARFYTFVFICLFYSGFSIGDFLEENLKALMLPSATYLHCIIVQVQGLG